jgi:hypothetical protein
MRLLAVLILTPAIVLAIAGFETRVFSLPSNGPTVGPIRGIVWNRDTFPTKTDFARWLRSRGYSYVVWARRHPVRAGIKPTPASPSKVSPRRLAARNIQAKAKGRANQPAVGEQGSSNRIILLIALAIVATLLAFVLFRRRPNSSPPASDSSPSG